ncbi:Xanthine/uracil permease [Metschnikowia bicuspidata var. bicuspidata NRRL YB-4993]|uniref:Xanthine/uracil permease n=1 Tax=Metschnikowia bicuspidata var. bicuspidata NRRL YB-4993 TaxID=869754 RepID=A0A1A0HJ63_9ASCO|nr:Xanthine/uracil permease [Metschnikowia bicuspidata var. bicuspidata NRRL YB-4993]OBA24194.1 Xanthine/uracil permease [Metschnikowia bicuspidata var. bicuspidata NRRL YB-4993]
MLNLASLSAFGRRTVHKWTTKEGFLGDYDYKYLFVPDVPFTKKEAKTQPFFGLNSDMPLFLGFILGFQHALAMLAGVVTPPLIISATANLSTSTSEYLVSASLIASGILSCIQITRFKIYGTPYYIGTGLLSVVGTSFSTITIVSSAFPIMYSNGMCSVVDGVDQACPEGYGRILATGIVCALINVLLSFTPSKILQKVFPAIVTGPVVLLIGVKLIESGFKDWVGGSSCVDSTCGKKNLPWGSAEFIGLGFLVYVTIILSEKFGSPIMKSCAVIVGLLVGCIVAAACGYFSSEAISAAPVITFPWVETFPLKIYGPLVLPFLAVYIVLVMEATGDITATCDVSRLEVEGKEFESRIQGGILCDGINGILSGLMTVTPMSTFAQNNGVISVTKCANRKVGYWCAFFLIIMGVFGKFAGAIVSIPKPVLGGMTSFLFTSVAVSGIKIISTTEFTRRDRFVLTSSLLPGFGATLVSTWFANVFTYDGDNQSLQGFYDAIVLVMETGFAVTGFVGLILNLILPQVSDDVEEINELVLETVGSADEQGLQAYATKEQQAFSTTVKETSSSNL